MIKSKTLVEKEVKIDTCKDLQQAVKLNYIKMFGIELKLLRKGKAFKYCPYCGKRLKITNTVDKLLITY